MNALIIGHGSAGMRHARILEELGCVVAVLSRRVTAANSAYASLGEALIQHEPEYVVVANETARHLHELAALATLGYAGTVLVEKPLLHLPAALPTNRFKHLFVGYNLRFHPILQRLKKLLSSMHLVALRINAGQHLSQWRPTRSYASSYSAHKDQGGGVLRDLSHELDYAQWLTGRCELVAAIGGRFGNLEIDSDDCYALLMRSSSCPVINVQVDYLDPTPRRDIVALTQNGSIKADLIRGIIEHSGGNEEIAVERDASFRAMHRAAMEGEAGVLCSAEEGLTTVALIAAAERMAALSGKHVVQKKARNV